MKNKNAQIKKYNVLAKLIEELYSKNPKYIDDYLFPFKDKIKNINMLLNLFLLLQLIVPMNFLQNPPKNFLKIKKLILIAIY